MPSSLLAAFTYFTTAAEMNELLGYILRLKALYFYTLILTAAI